MKAIFLALLSVLLVYYAYAVANVMCPGHPDPGKDYALVKHPCNCSSYYVCQGGRFPPTPMPCPPGLHWNEAKQYCDYPYKAHCKTSPGC